MKAKDVTVDMIELSDKSKEILEYLPLQKVIRITRRKKIKTYLDAYKLESACEFAVDGIKRDKNIDPEKRRNIPHFSRKNFFILGTEVRNFLESSGLIRYEFSKKFEDSSKIWVLRKCVKYGDVADTAEIKYSFGELLHDLNNDTYETFDGYDDDTFKAIHNFLKKNLDKDEYKLICDRFGLNGQYKTRKELQEELGLNNQTTVRNYELRAIKKLNKDEFLSLTKIS